MARAKYNRKPKGAVKADASPPPGPFADCISCNERLALDISNVKRISKNEDNHDRDCESQNETLKGHLRAFWDNLWDLYLYNHTRRSSKALMEAWASFFLPIDALSLLPTNGHLLAVRMLLYMTEAFRTENGLERRFGSSPARGKALKARLAFLFELDERLLHGLREIYRAGNRRETFDWVLSNYALYIRGEKPGSKTSQMWASATSVEELRAMGAIGGRSFWRRTPGDETDYRKDPRATVIHYGLVPRGNTPLTSDDEGDGVARPRRRQLIQWQQLGTDGPIRAFYHYRTIENGHEEHHNAQLLVRSRQFVLDARAVAIWHRAQDERYHARLALICTPLPAELREMVVGYLERPIRPVYVADFDLAEAYTPFPEPLTLPTNWRTKELPPPGMTPFFAVWCRPLRVFVTIHCFRSGPIIEYRPCRHFLECRGDHADPGVGARLSNLDISAEILSLIHSRCDPAASLTSVGLGPAEIPYQVWREEENLIELEDERATRAQIGVGGLLDALMHARVLQPRDSYYSPATPQWMFGRCQEGEFHATRAFREQHFLDREDGNACEFCVLPARHRF